MLSTASGARLSDHGLERAYATFPSDEEAAAIFDHARSGGNVEGIEKELFASYLMHFFGRLDHEKGWTKQLHLGAMRNNNKSALPPTRTGHWLRLHWRLPPKASPLSRYLGRLRRGWPPSEDRPLQPESAADNYLFATMIGNFQEGGVAGKNAVRQRLVVPRPKRGAMIWQMNALSNLGLLSRFVGMLTDLPQVS